MKTAYDFVNWGKGSTYLLCEKSLAPSPSAGGRGEVDGMLFEPFVFMVEVTFIKQVLKFSIAAAFVYCIAVFFYIRNMTYEETFVLYVGNFLFAAVIGVFVAWFYKKHESDIGTIKLVVIGGKAAVAGIVVACVMVFVMMFIFVPGVLRPAEAMQPVLKGAPGQFAGKNNGFGKILFMNAILGNAGASFFISLLIPFSVMKNLYPDEKRKGASTKAEENPKKNYHL